MKFELLLINCSIGFFPAEHCSQSGRPIENALDRKLIAKMDTLSERGFLGEKLGANLGAKISLGACLGALNRPLLSDNVRIGIWLSL